MQWFTTITGVAELVLSVFKHLIYIYKKLLHQATEQMNIPHLKILQKLEPCRLLETNAKSEFL